MRVVVAKLRCRRGNIAFGRVFLARKALTELKEGLRGKGLSNTAKFRLALAGYPAPDSKNSLAQDLGTTRNRNQELQRPDLNENEGPSLTKEGRDLPRQKARE